MSISTPFSCPILAGCRCNAMVRLSRIIEWTLPTYVGVRWHIHSTTGLETSLDSICHPVAVAIGGLGRVWWGRGVSYLLFAFPTRKNWWCWTLPELDKITYLYSLQNNRISKKTDWENEFRAKSRQIESELVVPPTHSDFSAIFWMWRAWINKSQYAIAISIPFPAY